MLEIQYLQGDATRPIGEGPRLIVHCCNDTGGWGKGFVLALSRRWKAPEEAYRKWYRLKRLDDLKFELGQVQFVAVEDKLWVANLIGQHGVARPGAKMPLVRYGAIRQGLEEVRNFAKTNGASVHMPKIGSGLAGGDWKVIAGIIQEELLEYDVPVTVYSLQ